MWSFTAIITCYRMSCLTPLRYVFCSEWLIILLKCNSAWNRVRWSTYCFEIYLNSVWHWQIPTVRMQQRYSITLEQEDWEQVAADNYKSKHTRWPFRPKVFLISQMWSTLPGVSLSLTLYVVWIAPLFQEVYHSNDGVLNRFLLHTLSLCCRDDSQAVLGGGTGL